jgi:hypothetical protein
MHIIQSFQKLPTWVELAWTPEPGCQLAIGNLPEPTASVTEMDPVEMV